MIILKLHFKMTTITITPRNKKELSALKHFIKALNLSFNETLSIETKNNIQSNSDKNDFEEVLKQSFTIDEFSQKTTSFLENLSWKK